MKLELCKLGGTAQRLTEMLQQTTPHTAERLSTVYPNFTDTASMYNINPTKVITGKGQA